MHWTVGRRITLAFTAGLGLVVVISVVGVMALARSSATFEAALHDERNSLLPALRAESDFRRARLEDLHFILKQDERNVQVAESLFAISRALLVQLRDSA